MCEELNKKPAGAGVVHHMKVTMPQHGTAHGLQRCTCCTLHSAAAQHATACGGVQTQSSPLLLAAMIWPWVHIACMLFGRQGGSDQTLNLQTLVRAMRLCLWQCCVKMTAGQHQQQQARQRCHPFCQVAVPCPAGGFLVFSSGFEALRGFGAHGQGFRGCAPYTLRRAQITRHTHACARAQQGSSSSKNLSRPQPTRENRCVWKVSPG